MRVLSKSIVLGTAVAFSAMLATSALAQNHKVENNRNKHAQSQGDKPINKLCPISYEPIELDAGTFEYKGNAIAICCAGCDDKFLAWDEPRKDMFVKMALAGKESEMADHDAKAMKGGMKVASLWTEPYALNTCAVSGEELGAMDDVIVKTYDGREVRFCCEGCIEDFEADQAGFFKKIDEKITHDQLRYYPAQTCIVSGESLVEDGEDIAVNMVYGNRLVRLCCKMCKKEFKADPVKFIEKLDEAVANAQRKDYPLDTCIVRGGELGSMGEPSEMVLAGRLLRFCCPMCEPKAKADPVKYLAIIDEAWQAKGMFMPTHEEAHDDDDAKADDYSKHGG